MNCPKCSHPLRSGSRFCGNCGFNVPKDILDVDKTQAADDLPPAQPERRAPLPPQKPAAPSSPQEYPARGFETVSSSSRQMQGNAAQQRDHSLQYQQYRQSGQKQPSTRKGDGSFPSGSGNTPLVIVVIVLAVILVGGGIVTLIMLFNNDGGKDKKNGAGAAQTTSVQPSSTVPATVSPADNRRRFVTDDGILLAEDDDIDITDSKTESLLKKMYAREEMESRISDINSKYSMYYTAELIIKGNTAATLLRMTDLLDDDDKKALMDSFKDDDPDASVPDYVLILALIDPDGKVYYCQVKKMEF